MEKLGSVGPINNLSIWNGLMEPYLCTCNDRRYIVQDFFTYVYQELAHIKISVIYYTIQVTMTLNLRLLISCFRANLFIVGCINAL